MPYLWKAQLPFHKRQADSLVLQRTPEPLDKDVVPETPFAVHAYFDVPGFEH